MIFKRAILNKFRIKAAVGGTVNVLKKQSIKVRAEFDRQLSTEISTSAAVTRTREVNRREMGIKAFM